MYVDIKSQRGYQNRKNKTAGTRESIVFCSQLSCSSLLRKNIRKVSMDKKFAVFVDAENFRAKEYISVIKEIANHGEILIKQVWGDWNSPTMKT